MPSGSPHLDDIINAHNFQKIQDCLSEASDMAMLTVDYQGTPVTRHSRCRDYCATVRSHPFLNDLCQKCDSRGGLEAARIGKPYLYLCHRGLLDFAVPIIVGGNYTGAVLAGQVVPMDEAETTDLERIADSREFSLEQKLTETLVALRAPIPAMTRDRIQVIANMTFQITNYIIEEAMVKIDLNESWEASLTPPRPAYNAQMVKPALEYIRLNYEKPITLDQMASLCNISSSYFSKLFHKITGDTFANHINQIRVTRACELLSTTDTPITVIALDLGFEDSSYFDKVFKRLTGVTPSFYKAAKRKAPSAEKYNG